MSDGLEKKNLSWSYNICKAWGRKELNAQGALPSIPESLAAGLAIYYALVPAQLSFISRFFFSSFRLTPLFLFLLFLFSPLFLLFTAPRPLNWSQLVPTFLAFPAVQVPLTNQLQAEKLLWNFLSAASVRSIADVIAEYANLDYNWVRCKTDPIE